MLFPVLFDPCGGHLFFTISAALIRTIRLAAVWNKTAAADFTGFGMPFFQRGLQSLMRRQYPTTKIFTPAACPPFVEHDALTIKWQATVFAVIISTNRFDEPLYLPPLPCGQFPLRYHSIPPFSSHSKNALLLTRISRPLICVFGKPSEWTS